MKELIPHYDVTGIQLREGDIVAEGKIGESIWDGQAIIKERALGVVVVHGTLAESNEPSYYNVCILRSGIAELTETANDLLVNEADSQKMIEFSLTHYDHIFQAWDDVEKIGSTYDLDKSDNQSEQPTLPDTGNLASYTKDVMLSFVEELRDMIEKKYTIEK